MNMRLASALLGSTFLLATGAYAAAAAPKVDADDIGGTVASAKGPEAGVWVIAETSDLATKYTKIVVTDDQGRFVLPDVPKGKYKVWVRGYGLTDSKPVDAVPGATLSLKATVAASAKEAAEVYPASYWISLIKVPPEGDFPGTGPQGNGINPTFKNQQDWIGHFKENCHFCHQLGTKVTREVADIGNTVEAWDQRIQKGRSPDDPFLEGVPNTKPRGKEFGSTMNNYMTMFGRQRGLGMFADWTDRIAKGEAPPAPPRPTGVERNIVVNMWDIGNGRFLHDSSTTDKRNPTVGGGGPVYAVQQLSGMVVALDPKTGKQEEFKLTNLKGEWAVGSNDHTSTIDADGRYWMSTMGPDGANHDFCTDGSKSAYAKLFPRESKYGKTVGVFNPKTKSNEMIPVCFGSHHLNFDNKDRLYFSGDTEVVGWLDVNVWDKTKDASKAAGWCPLVLDTNGDGKVTMDRKQWNEDLRGSFGGEGQLEGAEEAKSAGGAKGFDPKKDTRIAGFNYANGVSPKDQSYWVAKYTPTVPSGIIRFEPGTNPPETCKTEYYEAPKVNGKYLAFNARGVDVDADGVAWVAFGTGALGKFDRSKCKVLNGPTALGQQCPEGWEIIETPSPKLAGTNIGADWFYQTFVDHHDFLGLGKEIPVLAGSESDELLAYLPKEKKFVHLRVPYPLGFYPRGLDGRIDDVKTGWKGRGLWATNNVLPIWHQETGEGSSEFMVQIQMRPDPLAK